LHAIFVSINIKKGNDKDEGNKMITGTARVHSFILKNY